MHDVEEIVQFVKKMVLETGVCYPIVFVKGSEGKVAIGLQEFGDTSDVREQHMLNVGSLTAYKHGVGELETLVFASEAWMSKPNEKGEFIQPSRDPKRIETLIINCLDVVTHEETMITFEIVRNKQGKLADLKQMSLPDGIHVEGRLLPAFQKGYEILRPVTN